MTGVGGAVVDSGKPMVLEAAAQFMQDRALRLGAGLAYYGLITLAPLLILLIGVLGLVLGEEAVNGQLVDSLEQWVSADVALWLQDTMTALDVAGSFANLTVFSFVVLIFTASILFVAWKDALDVIWDVEYHPGVRTTLFKRLFGVASVGALAAILILILIAEAVLAMLSGLFVDEPVIDTAFRLATSVLPLLFGTLLLGAMYRFGTDHHVRWRAVWPGTVLAMVMLLVLMWGYGIYVDVAGTSVAGVASSALLLIVLVYFCAQVLLYGAEFIKVWQLRHHPDGQTPG
ncbi:MAG: YihY/virulence factor BrkB family protein [Acidimicrobiia bacterium]